MKDSTAIMDEMSAGTTGQDHSAAFVMISIAISNDTRKKKQNVEELTG